ncbi:MAG TPA: choice-of-anchor tandem repeat GloVer-containing protein [Candidatus Sulfotelmatobacter sp.]
MIKARLIRFSLLVSVVALAFLASAFAATETVLYSFNIADGETPYGGVIFDSAGNLYGTTFYGGGNGCGSFGCGQVFKLSPAIDGKWAETTIYTFTGSTDGSHPYSRLIFDSAGNLYGTTYGANSGGTGHGTAFRLSPNADGSWSFSLLHAFGQGKDGVQPTGTLAFDANGNLFGVTGKGGTANLGTVFELSPGTGGTWTEKVVHSFAGGLDGAYPSDGVVSSNGNIFGTTVSGGGTACSGPGCGVIFEFSPNGKGGWTLTFPRRFTGARDGEAPLGLSFDSAGNLYGSANGGKDTTDCPSGCGVVFRMTQKSNGVWTFAPLHYFNGGNGLYPEAVLAGPGGEIYGDTQNGGQGMGLIYELNPVSNYAETVLYEFLGGADGGEPTSRLTMDGAGNFYGTGTYGGAGGGVVFEVTP